MATGGESGRQRRLRLGYFVSHPIQYQAPLLRRIAREPELDLCVFYGSDRSVRGYLDEGFGVQVEWDVPLLGGYRHQFFSAGRGRWRRLLAEMERARLDAVWVHGYHTAESLAAIGCARLLDVPVLVRAESTLSDRPRSRWKLAAKEAFFRALRPHIGAALAIGRANARYWRHYLGEEAAVFPMPYAVDNQFFQARAQEAQTGREALRGELGLEAGRLVILFASKLQARKRCGDLVAALRRLGEVEGGRPYLLIVGDGEERKRLEAETVGDEAVRFLGFRNQTELPRFFDLCDVFVLPSVSEPWGLVVNEAMNAARAVIVSDEVGCAEDLVADGENGCVFRAGDVEALAQALRRVLERRETADKMGLASLRRVEAYSFEQDVRGLRAALAHCVPWFRGQA
jgi:glycosyltransferase involved in cell wall biosynthesis